MADDFSAPGPSPSDESSSGPGSSGPGPLGSDSSGPASSGPASSGPAPSGRASSGPAPTKHDRERYLRLLDSALSRGLLGDADYLLRADELLRATNIEQMNSIVQVLPLLDDPVKSPTTPSRGSRRRRTDKQIELPLASGSVERFQPPGQIQPDQMQPDRMQPDQIQPDRMQPGQRQPPDQRQPPEQYTPFDELAGLDPVDVAMMMRSRQARTAPSNRRLQAIAVVGILFLLLMVLGVFLALHDRSANGSSGLILPYSLVVASIASIARV